MTNRIPSYLEYLKTVAITTAGSGCMMFACQMVFFFKMGVLVCATIIFSVVFSLGLFMSLCVLIGPEGRFGDTGYYMKRCLGWDLGDHDGATEKRVDVVEEELNSIEIRAWKCSTAKRDTEASLEPVRVVSL